jgi:hypothetical protein
MYDNPYESPLATEHIDRTPVGSDKRKKLRRILLICLYLLAAIAGAMGTHASRSNAVQLLLPIMMASVATYLCVVDSRILGCPMVQSVHYIMFFTWPLAVPIYLIYSRGLRGLGMAVLHGIGLIVVATAAFHTAGYLAYGDLWFESLRV